ncbi:MAG: DUF4917 family protein [Endozoicomonas sp.]|uniref:DUF4917 family protein n=1 Tax=Endozoicomonas sp. TaxID=1892382 RepID=UPI003D9BF34C
MNTEIKKWEDICEDFTEGLLLGNGSSISFHSEFAYKSLKQHAVDAGLIKGDVEKIFKSFHTEDFELVLRIVWHAYHVNEALGIEDKQTQTAYEAIRNSLINAVRDIHCLHSDVTDKFDAAYKFAKRFSTICSLNYDLTLYWVCMYGNYIKDGHIFKDCFLPRCFDDDWERFREPYGAQKECSLFFYPHGNLVFARDKIENERKIQASDSELLNSILKKWENGSYVPLFVSEGTSDQKVKSIQSSYYLNTVYREVLPSLGKSVVIYGWGFGEHDLHIMNRICKGGTLNFAVSVFPDGKEEAYCNKVSQIIKDASGSNRKKVDITFFCSKTSKECWS